MLSLLKNSQKEGRDGEMKKDIAELIGSFTQVFIGAATAEE
jgi:hypothetical protein